VKIPIQNLYYLFCYAWRFIPEEVAIDLEAATSPDVLNLCAHVLTAGIDRLLRRGIDQGYIELIEETARIRGRIHLSDTLTSGSYRRGRAVCQFDELSPDVLHNRILRSTIRLLFDGPLVPELQKRVFEADRRLSGIATIPLSTAVFQRVQLHRNNGFYAFLLRVCELVYASLLPDSSGEGTSRFRDVLTDEDYMAAVFEEFIRNFYSLKQSELTVGRTQPKWNATAPVTQDLKFLPTMTTDVTLWSANRTIIIDAKYYKEALQSRFGGRTVHSANLYQLMAYLHGTESPAGLGHAIEGMLVYPVGMQTADLRYRIDEYRIRVYTLNLGQAWTGVESDLLGLIRTLE
jgi:5-methylcytosine-specific restriction enzyme subunit McrC